MRSKGEEKDSGGKMRKESMAQCGPSCEWQPVWVKPQRQASQRG
jgi:hypothetical protein